MERRRHRYENGKVGANELLPCDFEDDDGSPLSVSSARIWIKRVGKSVVVNAWATLATASRAEYDWVPTISDSYLVEWVGYDSEGRVLKSVTCDIFIEPAIGTDGPATAATPPTTLPHWVMTGTYAVPEGAAVGQMVAVTGIGVADTYASRAGAPADAFVYQLLSPTTARLARIAALDAFEGLTPGAPLYLGVDGALSHTPTTTEGEIDQVVGEAETETRAVLWTTDRGSIVGQDGAAVAADLADHIADADDPHAAAGYATVTQAAQDAADAAQTDASQALSAAAQVASDLADHAADMDLHGGGSDETTADLDIYVDADDGDDGNDGLTEETALATLMAAVAPIPTNVRHVVTLNLRGTTYAMNRAWLFAKTHVFTGPGKIVVKANDTWDPAVYTARVSGTAASGTTSDVIKTTGLTLNAERGYFLQMTSGDASGEWRTVRNNTTTDLVPAVSFGATEGAVPAPGDTFRVVQSACVIQPPNGAFRITPAGALEGGAADNVVSRYEFEGITFGNMGSVYRAGYIISSSTAFYGVRIEDQLRTEFAVLSAGDSVRYVTQGDRRMGWGCTVTASFLYSQHGGRNEGTFVANYVGGHGWISAGYVQGAYHSTDQELESMSYASLWGNVSLLMGSITCYPGHRLWVYYVDFVAGQAGPLITLIGADIMMSGVNTGESTGGITIDVMSGGKVHLLSVPTLGSSSVADYRVRGGTNRNKSYFSVGTRQYFEGALIERSS